jgi:hypothetical protein
MDFAATRCLDSVAGAGRTMMPDLISMLRAWSTQVSDEDIVAHMRTVRELMLAAAGELERMQRLTSEAQFQANLANALNTTQWPMMQA